MLSVTPGREHDFLHLREALAVSAMLSRALDATEASARPARRPLPSWLGARRRQPIPFPIAGTLLRRPA